MVLKLGFAAWLCASNWTIRSPRAGPMLPPILSPVAPSVPKILQSVHASQAPRNSELQGVPGTSQLNAPISQMGELRSRELTWLVHSLFQCDSPRGPLHASLSPSGACLSHSVSCPKPNPPFSQLFSLTSFITGPCQRL